MDSNPRSRCWVVSWPYNDVDVPQRDDVIRLDCAVAHSKLSRVKESVSTWYEFKHAQRASTVSAAFDQSVTLHRKPKEWYTTFVALECEWELKEECVMTHSTNSEEGARSSDGTEERTDLSAGGSQDGHPRTTGDSSDLPSSGEDDEFIRLVRTYRRSRKRARSANEE